MGPYNLFEPNEMAPSMFPEEEQQNYQFSTEVEKRRVFEEIERKRAFGEFKRNFAGLIGQGFNSGVNLVQSVYITTFKGG